MKKKFIIVICSVFIIFIIFQLSSCSLGVHELPVGVWKSSSPDIILYLDPSYLSSESNHFLGIYTYSGENVKVFISTDAPRTSRIRIIPVTARREGAVFVDEAYFKGDFRVSGNRMYFTGNYGQHADLFSQIIFHKVEDYAPINPENWFE